MSVQLCGIFVQVEQKKFERRLVVLVPVLLDQLAPTSCADDLPGRFVRAVPVVESSNWSEEEQHQHDHRLFQTLQTINKICEHCPALLSDAKWSETVQALAGTSTTSSCDVHLAKWSETVQALADNAQLFLAHSHEWVRLAGAQLLGHVFSSLDPQQIAAAAVSGTGASTGVLLTRPRSELRSLVLDLCAVLQLGNTLPELVEQVIKNLVFLARVLQGVSEQDTQTRDQGADCAMDDDEDESRIKISLAWMIRRMRRIVNTEIIQTPKSTQLRTAVFKWLGAVAVTLPKSQLSALLPHLMTSLVREMMVVEPSGDELRRLAKDVGDVMRRRVGAEEYTRQLARLQAQLEARRTGRKSKRAQEVITDPERAAKRKIKKHLKKKDFKKKKFDVLKGRKPGKRNLKRPVKIDDTM
uniref:U3 small nucleolar RNA-associated protein 20 C-terminal domain-containing protein n=1 Tax=Timema poppense TaxID=170557 RepID=A0A7R9H8T6_TIMPO|nr:unnamed protein product [Timema poppensis]